MKEPVLIQGAMAVETDGLAERLDNCEEVVLGGYRFWRGSCQGRDVIISRTEMGELNAACATTLAILHFKPGAVINQGLAGAHREDLHIGDMVVGECAVYLGGWLTPAKGKGEGSDPCTWTESVCGLRLAGDCTMAERLLAVPYEGGRLIKGCLGSGDLFTREADRILWLADHFNHHCEDMESIAVYKVCQRLGVPCIGLRIISNNELTGEPYTPSVEESLHRFLLKALQTEK